MMNDKGIGEERMNKRDENGGKENELMKRLMMKDVKASKEHRCAAEEEGEQRPVQEEKDDEVSCKYNQGIVDKCNDLTRDTDPGSTVNVVDPDSITVNGTQEGSTTCKPLTEGITSTTLTNSLIMKMNMSRPGVECNTKKEVPKKYSMYC